MSVERISSPIIITPQGQSFSALEINGDGFEVVNAAEERDSTGQTYPAGSQSVISVRPDTGSTINASYIKTGVIDANLMRAGLIQTVPSWNTKWYGAPADHAAVQMGFTGGSIAATAVSTGSGTVSLTLPGGHGLITGDYVRVSGLYFTTGTLLGGVGLNLPTNGPLDYASATVSTNTLTYSKSDITSGLTASTASTVYVGKAFAISSIDRAFDDPDNPAELSTVTVTTSSAHGFAVGDYIELTGTIETLDGVAYVTSVPTSTTFTFKQRFGDDISFDGDSTGISLPTLGTPVAIKVLKSYTQNADGSIHITSGTVDSTLIVGEISATEITIGSGESVVRVGNYPDAISPTFQGIWAGSANPSTAEFSVNTAGVLTATSGTIGGYTLASDRLTNLSTGATPRHAGLIDTAADDGLAFFAGATSTAGAGATFSVTNSGDVTAADLTVTGGSIDIGNFTLSTLGNITEKLVIEQKFITNENGVDLISTSSDGGEAYALSKAISDGIYTGVQNGSFGALPPTPANNINNSTNPLPYWTFTSSSANITAKLNDETPDAFPAGGVGIAVETATGKKLTFTVASGATTGSNAYVERYVAIPASVARSYTFQPRVAWRGATAGADDVIGYIETQYFDHDLGNKTGAQGNKTVVITGAVANTPTAGTVRYTYTADENNTIVAGDRIYVYEVTSSTASAYNLNGVVTAATTTAPFTFDIAGTPAGTYTSGGFARQYPGFNFLGTIAANIASGYTGFETWANPNSTGNVPANGAYLRIRVGVRVVATTSANRSLDVAEVRLDRGPIQLLLTDQTSPGVYGYGGMWLSGGQLYIRPNETGPGYDVATGLPHAGSTGIKNPEIDLVASSGQIFLNPSSTGSVVVQSKAAASGGSAAAVPLKVYGIASQTGDLQQWLGVSGPALASVSSSGLILGTSLEAQPAANQDAIVISGRAGGTSNYAATFTPTTLTSNRTITVPDATGTLALTSNLTGTTFDLTGDVTVTAAGFTVGGANSYVVSVDNDSHSHTLGTTTTGNYVATITSANSLISVAGSGAEGAAITLTGDLSPSLSSVTVSGAATFNGAVTLGDTTADSIRFLNMFQTTTITNSFNPRVYNASGSTPWRIFYDTSSERFKTNIVYMEDTDAILDVNPVSYHDKTDYETNGEESPRQYGFLAEDMASNSEGIAFVVHNGADAETIQYERLVVPLFSAMRALRTRIEELEARIAELDTSA